ncbi:hypothetical protein Pan44_26790 [Caulifigura coniformis]|uniref:Uncharacterized protein n=1 Tax=Caulifigura coniformis TaxID=2527983 RepID=A0A517SET5_9PLAN|nr:hypothetical protein [Caulifigura coniformis]QDT54644.1 hypothetical protein Pan44_26790 [Caulifigura coniformis]
MIVVFNSFQAVALFSAMPFLIGWLSQQTFPGCKVAGFVATIVYIISFVLLVACVARSLDRAGSR